MTRLHPGGTGKTLVRKAGCGDILSMKRVQAAPVLAAGDAGDSIGSFPG